MFSRGVRFTVTATIALGSLVLSATLALATYLLAHHYLLEQRERSALRQAFANAYLVKEGLSTSGAQVSDVLGTIAPPPDTYIFVYRRGEWFATSLDVRPETLTRGVAAVVRGGESAIGWSDAVDPSAVVVGVPLPAIDAEYYEVAVARELDRTLITLRLALLISAGATMAAGLLFGRAASRRALSPLGDVASAAARISSGNLETRLAATTDPDLATLVGAFNNMIDVVEERIQRDARFAADVSHELRTPLSTLVTSLAVLQNASDLSPRSERAVALMGGELERFRRSLEDLLRLGRLDAGVQETHRAVTDLRTLVSLALESGGRSQSLLQGGDSGAGPQVLVDRAQLERALNNLFDNADVHGGGLVSVQVVPHDTYADVLVADHGPGVASEDRERVFERFARAGARRSHTGTGLGLSIVAETARHHGGSVWCQPGNGSGAVFVLRLPTFPQGEST